ncbi:Ankyrin repeat family protein [Rhynchospora pubera]|uniref:Ankyrin repeat family protein n=1 Tax=Rhynchospora pubera TaxID=906938 RepID=A0AAV8G7C8_9POAL|nr:Ankyrin repeat family protein [Rhynchospora pubera]
MATDVKPQKGQTHNHKHTNNGVSPTLNPSEYSHSPAHHFVLLNNGARLSALLASLPSLSHPSTILSLSHSVRESSLAASVSGVLDRRDVPGNDTPLHIAVRLNRPHLASLLLQAGADPSLQNASGWSPLHLAISLERHRLVKLMLKHYRLIAWAKLRRRLHLLLPALRQMQDSYLEISFRLESPIVPFLSRAAPSDTCRVWKRGTNVRADVSLAGFDGLRPRRAERSFVFLAAPEDPKLPIGSLLVLHHSRREVHDIFSGIEDTESDDELIADSTACRPGLNITSAELVPRTSWRGKEKTELVAGTWKARSYDLNNILFTFKTLQTEESNENVENNNDDHDDNYNDDVILEEEDVMMPLRIREDDGEFLVADIAPPRRSCYEPRRRSRVAEEADVGRRRRSVDVAVPPPRLKEERNRWERKVKCKEKETVKSLRPTVWLTEEFPLKIEEILPLLDILSNGVRAVRRLRELLTNKFPPGTFPVKVAIPVVPTIRVVVTFTKFVPLQPEQFFTPLSSPSLLERKEEKEERLKQKKKETSYRASSWLKWGTSTNNSQNKSTLSRSKSVSPSEGTTVAAGTAETIDPFLIPSDYSWVHMGSKNQAMKKSSSRKGKI